LNKQFRAVLAIPASLAGASAFAAVPPGVEGAFTTMATDFATLLGYGVTLAVVIWGGYLILANGRKMLNKTGK